MDSAGNPVIAGFAGRYGSGSDFFTAKLAGTTGKLLWEKFYGGQSNLTYQAAAVAVDGAGNVIVTGTSQNTPSDRDYTTVKYAPGPDLDTDGDGLLDSWEVAHFGSIVGHSALDDNDRDGRVELLELAFANNPNDGLTGSGVPLFTFESGFLTVTITKQPGVTYVVEGAYTPHPAGFSIRNTEVLINNATTLKARHHIFGDPEEIPDSRFLRVKVLGAPY